MYYKYGSVEALWPKGRGLHERVQLKSALGVCVAISKLGDKLGMSFDRNERYEGDEGAEIEAGKNKSDGRTRKKRKKFKVRGMTAELAESAAPRIDGGGVEISSTRDVSVARSQFER